MPISMVNQVMALSGDCANAFVKPRQSIAQAQTMKGGCTRLIPDLLLGVLLASSHAWVNNGGNARWIACPLHS